MIAVRLSEERGATKISWLDSKHTFSFNQYYDPRFMNFRSLRVINDDVVAPGGVFGTHPHQDMEIITYVVEGSVAHKDSSGGSGMIRPGDAQRMTAGTGIYHSEANGSKTEPVRFLQIWIQPDETGLKPGYEQKTFTGEERKNQLRLIASGDESDAAITIHQDARMYAGLLDAGVLVEHQLEPGRSAWVQVVRGDVTLNGERLRQGDGAAVRDEATLRLAATTPAEVILFDLA